MEAELDERPIGLGGLHLEAERAIFASRWIKISEGTLYGPSATPLAAAASRFPNANATQSPSFLS